MGTELFWCKKQGLQTTATGIPNATLSTAAQQHMRSDHPSQFVSGA
jgi:hypothetical protein